MTRFVCQSYRKFRRLSFHVAEWRDDFSPGFSSYRIIFLYKIKYKNTYTFLSIICPVLFICIVHLPRSVPEEIGYASAKFNQINH